MPDLYPPRVTPPETLARSRAMRRNATKAESKLWYQLHDLAALGCKFRRQFPIGNYIVDFCCIEKRLVVELDGTQHLEKTKPYDDTRTKELEKTRLSSRAILES
jgi:very-short-patch-repair endonuclease